MRTAMRTAMPATDTGPPARRSDRFGWERALRGQLPPRTHHVALVLATYADADGTSVRPGIALVAHDARMAPSTARAHIKTLRDRGWLRRVTRGSSGGTAHDADEHHLTVPVGVAVPRPSADRAPHEDADEHRPEATAAIMPPPARQRSSTPALPAGQRSSTSTTAHQPAVPPHDHRSPAGGAPSNHRSPVSGPPPASERTTAGQPAPTNQDQIMTKPRRRVDAYASPPPPPRCPNHCDLPTGWVAEDCGDCATLRRAHRARHTDDARAEARARRACTECNAFGLMLGLDRELLDIRCAHPTVPDEIWSGEATHAPPNPPPAEAPERRGRHAAPDNALPVQHPPRWRPSPHPRHRTEEALTDAI